MISTSRVPVHGVDGNPARGVPEMALSTQRDAEHLANRYGFATLAALAESLPEGAEVLDVGAGASPLGGKVALLRPDVRWTNVDYSYDDPLMRDELMPGAPRNLAFVAGDARRLGDIFSGDTFDRVFSFWLFPHLSLAEDVGAFTAAEEIFKTAKDGAEIFIGPVFNSPYSSGSQETPYGDARRTIKSHNMSADEFAREVVRQTRLPIVARHLHRSINQAIFEQFGTSRYARMQGNRMQVFDAQAGEYVDKYSRRGIALISQFAVAVAMRFVVPGGRTVRG